MNNNFYSVSGFDHTPLDVRQQGWYQYLYPYRLGNYTKRSLAPPVCLSSLDFRQPAQGQIVAAVDIPMHTAGKCDGVALWVDYVLDEHGNELRFWNGTDFPPYLTQSIKFFRDPRIVEPGNILRIQAYYEPGQSDLEYAFNFLDAPAVV